MFTRWIIVTLVLVAIVANLWPAITLADARKGRQRNDTKKKMKCGEHKPLKESRVKNRVGKGEFPFLTDIIVTEQEPSSTESRITYNCTGAIISKRRILTSLKCIGHGKVSKVDYQVRLGSNKFSKGNLVEVKKSSSIKYNLYNDEEEGGDKSVSHGLALIVVDRIKYQLNHKNHTDINRACFSQNGTFPEDESKQEQVEWFAPSWVPGHRRAKVVSLKPTECEQSTMGKAFCMKPTAKRYQLQEGTPLVRYKGKKRWEVVGIHSRRFEPWGDCDDDRCADEPANFIPVQEKSMKQWLAKEIYGT